eukprot:IDg18885t1
MALTLDAPLAALETTADPDAALYVLDALSVLPDLANILDNVEALHTVFEAVANALAMLMAGRALRSFELSGTVEINHRILHGTIKSEGALVSSELRSRLSSSSCRHGNGEYDGSQNERKDGGLHDASCGYS